MQREIADILHFLERYPPKEINRLYKEQVLQSQLEYFEKYPEVRWADHLKEQMIQQAKEAAITPGRLQFIDELISHIFYYNEDDYLDLAMDDLIRILNLAKNKSNPTHWNAIAAEFSSYDQSLQVGLLRADETGRLIEEVTKFNTYLQCNIFWNVLETTRFAALYDYLELLIIEDEEYLTRFEQIWELRVFTLIKKALASSKVQALIDQQHIELMHFTIAMHDCTEHALCVG